MLIISLGWIPRSRVLESNIINVSEALVTLCSIRIPPPHPCHFHSCSESCFLFPLLTLVIILTNQQIQCIILLTQELVSLCSCSLAALQECDFFYFFKGLFVYFIGEGRELQRTEFQADSSSPQDPEITTWAETRSWTLNQLCHLGAQEWDF